MFKVLGLFYFFLIMVVGSFLFKEQQCISSSLVETINIIRPDEEITFRGCQAPLPNVKAPIYGEIKILKLIDTVSGEFETFLNKNKWQYTKPYKWQIGGVKPIESDDHLIHTLESENLNLFSIRKKIASKWIKNLRKHYETSNPISDEILGDVLVYLIWNQTASNLTRKHYTELVFSELALCQSAWVPEHLKGHCRDVLEDKDKKQYNRLSEWSLRPLFLKAFIEKYWSLDIRQKVNFESTLFLKLVKFQVPETKKLKLNNINQLLVIFSENFWQERNTHIPNTFFEDIWLYVNNDINEKSLIFNGKYLFNPNSRSYFEFENFFVKRIHMEHKIGLRDLKKLNAEYVYIKNSQKVHIPSLKLAQIIKPKIFDTDNTIKTIEETIGWNPVLATGVDPGI